MACSVAWKGASSMMAAYKERHPTSGLWAIKRFPGRRTRPCVSPTEKIGTSEANIATLARKRARIIRLHGRRVVLRDRGVEAADGEERKLVLRPRRGLCLFHAQLLIFAGIEEQGPVVAGFEVFHFPDKQRVIAGRVSVHNPHDEV